MKITKNVLEYRPSSLRNPYNWFILLPLFFIAICVIWFNDLPFNIPFLVFRIVLTALLVAVLVCAIVKLYRDEKSYIPPNTYIAEDKFIGVYTEKRLALIGRYRLCFHYTYTVKFSKNGKYVFENSGKYKPNESDTKYVTAKCSVPGDKFYLVIREYEDRKEIVKCFNARFFIISKEDFEFVDGKYIVKN